jgi:hypothetical protein
MPKQTAAQRSFQKVLEQEETRAREAAWEIQKHERLIRALAQAHSLGEMASVFMKYDAVCYSFSFEDDVCYTGPMAELSESMMDTIDHEINMIKQARERKQALRQVYDDLIQELTPEQQEALRMFQ